MMHGNTKLVLVSGSGPITLDSILQAICRIRKAPSRDKDQLSLSAALDSLYSNLSTINHFLIPDEHLSDAAQHYAGSSSLSLENLAGIALAIARAYSFIHTNPKCIYIHGSVGAGKSMLMDTFYQTCNTGFANDVVQYDPITMKCMRCDFNEFMLDVHQPIHAYKKSIHELIRFHQ